jgi:predicted nucleotidyltransferase
MLKIFNDLCPFFKDSYSRINVREYARIINVSPPSASKFLSNYESLGLLKKRTDKNYIFYYANKENKEFIQLSKAYWLNVFENLGLLNYLEKELLNPLVILFGSFSKAEINNNSDIDIVIFTKVKKSLDLLAYEKKLNRKFQIFMYEDVKEVKNKELLNNFYNGFILIGGW